MPAWRTRETAQLGVSVGADKVRVVEMRREKATVAVGGAGWAFLPDRDAYTPQTLGRALALAHKRSGGKSRRMVLGLAEPVIKHIVLPPMPGREIPAVLRWELRRLLANPALYYTDYQLLPPEGSGGRKERIILAAVPRPMVDLWVAAARHSDFGLVAVDAIPLALWRALGGAGEGGLTAVVEWDTGRAVAAVFIGSVFRHAAVLTGDDTAISAGIKRILDEYGPEAPGDHARRIIFAGHTAVLTEALNANWPWPAIPGAPPLAPALAPEYAAALGLALWGWRDVPY